MSNIVSSVGGEPICPYDADRVRLAALAAAAAVNAGNPVVSTVLEPGNGTQYVLVLTRLDLETARAVGNTWLLSVPGKTSYPIAVNTGTSVWHVQQRWLPRLADAAPVAEFLNHLAWNLEENVPHG